jgi:hypothetical protein
MRRSLREWDLYFLCSAVRVYVRNVVTRQLAACAVEWFTLGINGTITLGWFTCFVDNPK